MIEFIGIILAFIAFKIYNMTVATFVMLAVSLLAMSIKKIRKKKITKLEYISVGLLFFVGLLTILTSDPLYIKMKSTILSSLIGTGILIGTLFNFNSIKFILNEVRHLVGDKEFQIKEEMINYSNICYAMLHFTGAFANYFVSINYSDETWYNFKLFVYSPLLTVSTIIIFSLCLRITPSKTQ